MATTVSTYQIYVPKIEQGKRGFPGATGGSGGTEIHSELTNLDYASAGHTGFAPIASPTFTGIATSPAIKVTTGAAAGNILISDADGDLSYLAAGATTEILVGGGAANPVWTTASGTGAPIRAGSPTFTGTVTTPSLIVEDLTDGYVPYQVAATDKLGNSPIFTDGTNVGIGTAAPTAAKLCVESAAGSPLNLVDTTATSGVLRLKLTSYDASSTLRDAEICWRHDLGAGTQSGVQIQGQGDGGNYLQTVVLTSTGLGIGAAAPNRNLCIVSATADSIVQLSRNANTYEGLIELKTSSTQDWLLGLRSLTNSDFHLYSFGTLADALTILRASGNVGIGTTAPGSYKLNVNGTANFVTSVETAAIKITTGATNGYYLRSDADGNGSWAAVTASSVYKGVWDASGGGGGSPSLSNGTGTAGWYYKCTAAGTVNFGANNITFAVADEVYYNGSIWERIPLGYILITATASVLGGIKVGGSLQINSDVLNVNNADMGDITVSGTGADVGKIWTINDMSSATFAGKITDATGTGYVVLSAGPTFTGTVTGGDFNTTVGYGSVRLLGGPSGHSGYINWLKSNGTDRLAYLGYDNTDLTLVLENGADFLINGGNTGIGTTTPDSLVHIYGTSHAPSLSSSVALLCVHSSSNVRLTASAAASSPYGMWFQSSNGTGNAYPLSLNPLGGNVGIGTMSPATPLDVNGVITATSGNSTQWNAAYTHSLDNSQAHSDYLVNNASDATSGTLTAVNFLLSSDITLKTNIKPISLEEINIDYKQFELKSEIGQIRYGVIAQELQKTNPELVRTDKDGLLSVAYIDLMIHEIAYLKNKINELERRIN